jgi:alpha-beta hydrolase superfamily lysophospholipase
VRCRHPNIPVYWYGESLGSLIVSHALGAQDGGKATVDGIILSSPIIGFRQEVPWWKYWLIRGVAAVWPSKRIALESLGDSEVKVTNDTTHKQQMEKTDHYVQYFTLRLFREIEKMVRGSGGLAPKFHVPILLFYTPNDVFTSREQVEEFYDRLGSKDKTKIFYPDSYHLLLHDKDRPNVLKELDHWFQRLAGEKK